ncbi:hypothetical protein [Beijerinckia indica]|uniref:hypothetical protein n=1 Tax=Beijerinckia indica TaxID=533 RepID=UPI00031835E2|nr:hypothetical protein [Beijerinckia indica]
MSKPCDLPILTEKKRIFEAHLAIFSRLPAHIRARYWKPDYNTPFVYVEADHTDFTGIVLGDRDEPYEDVDDFDRAFTLFSLDCEPAGELLTIYGWNCHVERV